MGGIYLQTDARWADDKVGGSGEKMRAVGCTVCCVSMALEHCGFAVDPGRLNGLLKEDHGYTRRGWIRWFAVSKLADDRISVEIPGKPTAEIIDSTLGSGYPVIAKVMIGPRVPHWVLIVGKEDGDYLIKDPLGDGRGLEKLSKYKSGVCSIRILKNRGGHTDVVEVLEGQVRLDEWADSGGTTEKKDSMSAAWDAFADAARHSKPTVVILSSIDGGPWARHAAIYPLKGQQVRLKVDNVLGGRIRWFQIVPDTSKTYKNANFPWEQNPYQWAGFAKIDYHRGQLGRFRSCWEIEPFGKSGSGTIQEDPWNAGSRYYHEDVGSFWFQAEVAKEGVIYRSAGVEDGDHKGLSPQVFRVSVRDGEGYLGYLTSFFNVPGLFGSVTYQSENYIGVDCADVLVAAYGKWRKRPMRRNYNVAMVVSEWPKVKEFDVQAGNTGTRVRWGADIRPGDFIAVRYKGGRQYQHIGAFLRDANTNGILDGGDVVIHAGPEPLHYSYLSGGNFDGHVAVVRPE
ncbi:MAG: hypothetical protein ACYST6_13395 [Planctomycetota bacterium]